MLGIFLVIYLAYRNGLVAKLKGKNTTGWVLLTVVSYLFCYVLGFVVVLIILINNGQLDINSMNAIQGSKANMDAANQFVQIVSNNYIHLLTMEAFGLGGYLLIRYFLERMPDVNIPKDHEGVV
jgi:hypothetical protein